MATLKTGLEYYSHCIGMTKDKKLRAVRKEYGSAGVDVWLALLDMIYGDKGYYIDYSDTNKDDVVWEILDYVKGKYAPAPEIVEGIIESLVACGLFSDDLFKLGILSSKRIQKQFYAATVERKAVEINPEYWLLDLDEMRALSTKSSILRFFQNRPIMEQNRPIMEQNRPIMEQSKVKKRKVKESKDIVPKSKFSVAPQIAEAWQAYVDMRKSVKKPLTEKACELAINKLESLAPNDYELQTQILNQSVFNSWLGLFPVNDEKRSVNNGTAPQPFKPSDW